MKILIMKALGQVMIGSVAVIGLAVTACKKDAAKPKDEVVVPDTSSKYKLAWSDEFDGSTVNTKNWNFDTGHATSGWGNNEKQYYKAANASIADGNLQITARKDGTGADEYTSARMTTLRKYDFTYGKVEARMKLPEGLGLWPAFWMLGSDMASVGWPKCGEIDIMERINNEIWISGAAHWDKAGHSASSKKINTTPTVYHVYGVEWDKEAIRWYIDGQLYHQVSTKDNVDDTDEFHKPFNILLNLAVGGNWPGQIIDDTKLPAVMLVDYVRVYKEK